MEKQKELIQELSQIALKRVKELGAEGYVNASVAKQFAARFSNSEILQNYADFMRNFELTVIYKDKQKSSSYTNDLSENSIIKLAEYVTKIAKLVPPDPMYPGLLKEDQKYPNLKLNDPNAKNLQPIDIVDKIEGAIIAGEAVDSKVAGVSGNLLLSDGFDLYASSADVEVIYPSTNIGTTINTQAIKGDEESRSNSDFGSRSFNKLDMETESIEVAERAVNGLGAISIEPGEYEVILDHQAASAVIRMTSFATSSMQLISRRSFLNDQIGQQVFDQELTLINDPHNTNLLSARPIDDEGLATQKFPLVENGVLKNYTYSRLHAAKLGAKPKGCGFSFFGQSIGFPFALTMKPGNQTRDDLILSVDDGLLVTNFHYTNYVNPPLGSITGMSKDGFFIIKSGEIVGSAKNMRFTDEIPRFMKDIEIGKELKQPAGMMGIGNMVVPIKAKSFKFTSKTEH
jgi:PmbA protein